MKVCSSSTSHGSSGISECCWSVGGGCGADGDGDVEMELFDSPPSPTLDALRITSRAALRALMNPGRDLVLPPAPSVSAVDVEEDVWGRGGAVVNTWRGSRGIC